MTFKSFKSDARGDLSRFLSTVHGRHGQESVQGCRLGCCLRICEDFDDGEEGRRGFEVAELGALLDGQVGIPREQIRDQRRDSANHPVHLGVGGA